MKKYLDLVRDVLNHGEWTENRTGVRTLSMPGAHLRFNLQNGFPAVTTKKLGFKSVMGELVGFLKGKTNAADFRALGSKVWDQNANENTQWLNNPYRKKGQDDLGKIYGYQWRSWPAYKSFDLNDHDALGQMIDAKQKGYEPIGTQSDGQLLMINRIDQIAQCFDLIENDPTSRRIIFHGWNCANLDEGALPPCHLLYQFLPNPNTKEMSLCLYIRSSDLGLGLPYNLAQSATLLSLVSHLTGYTPKWLNLFLADAHIYETHLPMLTEQIERTPYCLPTLKINERLARGEIGKTKGAIKWIDHLNPNDFELIDYQHYGPLTAPMAV